MSDFYPIPSRNVGENADWICPAYRIPGTADCFLVWDEDSQWYAVKRDDSGEESVLAYSRAIPESLLPVLVANWGNACTILSGYLDSVSVPA